MEETHHPTVRIFVYGTLRRGESNDINRRHATPLGSGKIRGFLYDLQTCPGVLLSAVGFEVVGEVHEIPAGLIPALDELESGCGDFRRRVVLADIGGGRSVSCLVYESGPGQVRNAELIRSGDWVSHRRGLVPAGA
ncbi:MAG TPA: gamma-glutamylcyclotransferase family protein [Burkholderiaceae bacterium]